MKRRDFLKSSLVLGAAVGAPEMLAQLAPAGASRRRLFFSPERIERLRLRLPLDAGLRARWARLIERADALVTANLTTQAQADNGPGPNANYPRASKQAQEMAMALGLAWQVTHDPRYADKLREALLHFVANYTRWHSDVLFQATPRRHSDLWTSAFTTGCAAGYDALFDRLTAAERAQIAAGIVRLGIQPLLADWVLPEQRIRALDSMGHNWWSVCIAGAGMGALALLGEDPRAAGWVQATGRALDGFFGYRGLVLQNKTVNFDPAGAFYEGVGYTDYALSEYLLFRLARRNVLPDFAPAAIPVLERSAEFFAHTLYPASSSTLTVNFGDSSLQQKAVKTVQLLAIQGFSPALARWYLQRVEAKSSDPVALLYLDDVPASPENSLPLSVIYPAVGWAVLRSSWDNDATLLAVKSGFTWNHAHADAGSFILFHAGQPLLIDSGTCDYGRPEYRGYYSQSRAHNVVLYNGQSEPAEDIVRGSKFPGQVHSLLDGLGVKYLYADATGPMARYLTRNYRHWLWLDGVILIIDDLLAHDAGRFDWLLHYAGTARRDGAKIEITNGPAQARVTMLFPEQPVVREEQGLAERAPDRKVPYLALSSPADSREQKFIVAIVPQPLSDAPPPPTVELLTGPDVIGVRVRSAGQITDVYLNLLADGRKMHLNSNHTIAGWETDAYLFALSRPATAAAATPATVTRYFVVAGSYLRIGGQSVLDSLSKVNALFQADEELNVCLNGQNTMDVTLYCATKPARLKVNGAPTPFENISGEKLVRFSCGRPQIEQMINR